ncbi:MAG: DUF1501 domain-containing protein [Planctomycetaceae bacterium]|nr:DUF1501 domain-containing protein [Planctomycetaceae bacterium]
MLTVYSSTGSTNCQGIARRDFLRAGALSLGGWSLADLLRTQASAAGSPSIVRDKAVVVLFLSGGASHIETFDPKLSAPSEIRSMTGETTTSLPGVTFGGTFTRLAARAQRLSIVRSFQHPINEHVAAISHVLTAGTDRTGKGSEGFSMGALYSRFRGTNHPTTGLPTFSLLTADEVDRQYSSEKGRVQQGSAPRVLGQAYAPFDIAGKSDAVKNMRLNLSPTRLDDRRQLLAGLDRVNRAIDSSGAMESLDRFQQQAVNVVLGSASQAFDLQREDPRLIEKYDTSDIRIGHNKYRDSTLGHQFLLSRRLIEAGCGFVTIHSAGWDMHADGNNPGILDGMSRLGLSVDQAVSVFLDDLAERGLSEKVLLVITGDFGRTPRINKRGGRDHWANLCTLAFAGGGLKMGQVVGQSAKNADVPGTDPITPGNLLGTVMHQLFDVSALRLKPGVPRDVVKAVEDAQPIAALI